MPDADVPFLDIRELSVGFGGILVLENVSFSTPTASITGLIGPNGAGKTTLMNCISGHVKTRSGSILLGHQQLDLTKKPPRARPKLGVARTYQHSELFEGLTVVDQLMCGAYAIGHHPIFPSFSGRRGRSSGMSNCASLHWTCCDDCTSSSTHGPSWETCPAPSGSSLISAGR